MTRYSALILAFSLLAACSGDDDSGGGGTCMPGTSSACTCADGMMTGSSLCGANGVPGACLPCMAAAGTGGMGGAGGMGGMSGAGGMSGMGGAGGMGGMSGGMGATGGTGGMTMDDDAGMMDDDGGVEIDAAVDSGTDAGGDTAEGEQNGSCGADDQQCDDGLGCYRPDMNLTGFCTLECQDDDDCNALGGADWTCYTMGNLCRVQCDSGNGNDDCPDGFECTDVLGGERCVPMD